VLIFVVDAVLRVRALSTRWAPQQRNAAERNETGS
jgi:hypothetical protein